MNFAEGDGEILKIMCFSRVKRVQKSKICIKLQKIGNLCLYRLRLTKKKNLMKGKIVFF